MLPSHETVSILGLSFLSADTDTAHSLLASLLADPSPHRVYTPNPEFLAKAYGDPRLHSLLSSADLLLPDGMGILLAARIGGQSLPCRLTGIDLGEWVLAHAAREGLSVFLLGAAPSVAEAAAENLRRRFPTLHICGTQHGYFDKSCGSVENQAVIETIRSAAPHILFVCFGFPAQEQWIAEQLDELPSVRLAMGLGGSLDVWSGRSRRAPKVMQRTGLEWLWRVAREPRRLRSLKSSFICFPLVWKERWFRRKKKIGHLKK